MTLPCGCPIRHGIGGSSARQRRTWQQLKLCMIALTLTSGLKCSGVRRIRWTMDLAHSRNEFSLYSGALRAPSRLPTCSQRTRSMDAGTEVTDRSNVTTPTPGSGYETQLKLESSSNSPICC